MAHRRLPTPAVVLCGIVILAVPPATHSAGGRSAGTDNATAAAGGYAVPKCPRSYRAKTRHWSGWYACYRKRARKRWVAPSGCRGGYSIWRRTLGAKRAWRCKPPTPRTEPKPPPQPQPQPTPPPPTQPPPGVNYQQLINIAFNAANEQFRYDLYSTQYNYTNRVENGWINARLDSNNNVVSPVYAPGTYAEGVYWAEGCRVENTYAASCTLAERVFDGGDSSRPTRRTVRRKLFTVTLGADGRYSVNVRHPDFFNGDVWYYICYTGPNGERLSGVPYC